MGGKFEIFFNSLFLWQIQKGTDAVSVPFFHLVPFLRYISAVGVRYIRREFTHGVFAEVIAGRAQSS